MTQSALPRRAGRSGSPGSATSSPIWLHGAFVRSRASASTISARRLAKVTDSAPLILLAHEPDIARRVPSRVALQLSGHTHGGQVRLAGWSPIAPSGRELTYGHIRKNCDVVVSGGLGCSIMPFRFGVPPEIVLVTLGGAKAQVA